MGYCSQTDIEHLLAQSLTSSTQPESANDTLIPYINVGNSLDTNLVSKGAIQTYILDSDSYVDAALSQLYATPFLEKVAFEAELQSPIGASVSNLQDIVTTVPCSINVGDTIILKSKNDEDRVVIGEVTSPTIFETVENIPSEFSAGKTRITKVSFPDPIRWISARLAAANIYDKYFSAEASPNTSKYGDYLRNIADQQLAGVMNGTIVLHGQYMIGRRFINPALIEQYSLPSDGGFKTGKGWGA